MLLVNATCRTDGIQAWIAIAGAPLSACSSFGKSSYIVVSQGIKGALTEVRYHVKDDPDHQTAAGAHRNFFSISEVCDPDLEAIATRARVVIDLEGFIEAHVFNLNLIVYIQIVCHLEW